MELTTLIGILAVVVFYVAGILWGGGQLIYFFDPASIMVTLGGTIATMFMAYNLSDLANLGRVYARAFMRKEHDVVKGIQTIIELANVARKEGLLAMEEGVKEMGEPFLQKGVLLIVDGTDPELVKSIMEAELSSLESRHSKSQGILDTMASYAPAMGMLGTLLGLINMLQNLSDPSALGPGMSVALVTTFYGSLIANVICNPISSKLRIATAQEILYKEILLEGMLSIQAGENPRIIEEKLYSFLPRTLKEQATAAAQEDEDAE